EILERIRAGKTEDLDIVMANSRLRPVIALRQNVPAVLLSDAAQHRAELLEITGVDDEIDVRMRPPAVAAQRREQLIISEHGIADRPRFELMEQAGYGVFNTCTHLRIWPFSRGIV